MAFTDAEKIDIRRFCGYGAYGKLDSQAFGLRFSQWYGRLEWLMENSSSDEEVVVRKFLTELRQLDDDVFNSRVNIDTDAAAIWKHNSNEINDRIFLFNHKRVELCDFFKIPFGGSDTSSLDLVI
jgi:hypothetical protein